MHIRSFLAAAMLVLAPVSALATPQPRDGSEMWFNPSESGWGLNIFHQGDTLFAALFVYGPDSQPKWYVASSMAGGPVTYFGALFEASGPPFSGPFDPATVSARQVGTMTFTLGSFNAATLDYTVDGVHVTKAIVPFTFRKANLTGNYYGYEYQPAANGTPEIRRDLNISIADNGTSITMADGSDSEGSCSYSGTRGQTGAVETVSGTFTCAGASGPWSMDVDPTPDGFTGSFTGHGITNSFGRIAASIRSAPQTDGNGWRTDNWFPPNESGWGLNTVEQGDTIFATLFVYDAQRKPHWYVASALSLESAPGPNAVFSGPLVESTGPYFGGPFNAGSVTSRIVGNMAFELTGRNTAVVGGSIDGVSFTKNVSRFAFRNNDLSGSYIGHTAATNADAPAGLTRNPILITIQDGSSGFVMTTNPAPTGTPPTGASCTFTGPPAAQFGSQKFVGGNFSCTGGQSGTFSMDNLFVTFDGFTGSFQGLGVVGNIEGARLGTN
jgi:hypothetical protein